MKPFLTCQLLWLNFELRFMKPSLQNTNFCSDIWTIFNDMAHFKPYTGANIEYFLILEIWRNLKLAGVSCGCLKSKPKFLIRYFQRTNTNGTNCVKIGSISTDKFLGIGRFYPYITLYVYLQISVTKLLINYVCIITLSKNTIWTYD